MDVFMTFSILFFGGSVFGWILELFFRKFFSSQNPEHKWINPGFLTGPYVPLYGMGLCLLYILADIPINTQSTVLLVVIRFFEMGTVLTALEFVVGFVSLKVTKVRLWDYSKVWGNIMGLVCPKFYLAWGALGTAYVFLLHSPIKIAVGNASVKIGFIFAVGVLYGVFVVDAVYSFRILTKIKTFAKEHRAIVAYEEFKGFIRKASEQNKEKIHYLFAFLSETPMSEHLKKYFEQTKLKGEKLKEKIARKTK